MLNVIILSVIMLNAIMLNVVVLNIVAPKNDISKLRIFSIFRRFRSV